MDFFRLFFRAPNSFSQKCKHDIRAEALCCCQGHGCIHVVCIFFVLFREQFQVFNHTSLVFVLRAVPETKKETSPVCSGLSKTLARPRPQSDSDVQRLPFKRRLPVKQSVAETNVHCPLSAFLFPEWQAAAWHQVAVRPSNRPAAEPCSDRSGL